MEQLLLHILDNPQEAISVLLVLLIIYGAYKFIQINGRVTEAYVTQSKQVHENSIRTYDLERKVDELQDDNKELKVSVKRLENDNMQLKDLARKYYKYGKQLYKLYQDEKTKRIELEDRLQKLEALLKLYRERSGRLPDDNEPDKSEWFD